MTKKNKKQINLNLQKEDRKKGLLNRFKNIEDKNKEQLKEIQYNWERN